MALVLHFIKSGSKAVGLRLIDNSLNKEVYSSYITDHSKFPNPWQHLLHHVLNWRRRVYPKELLLLPQKQSEYLNSLTVLGDLYPFMLEKGYKTSLFFDPMMLTENPTNQDCIQISDKRYLTVQP